MRRIVPLLLLPIMSACAGYSYQSKPLYSAACTVEDRMPNHAYKHTIYATGANYADLSNNLLAQNAGTTERPCLNLQITDLYPSNQHKNVSYPTPSHAQHRIPSFKVQFAFDKAELDSSNRTTVKKAADQILRRGFARVEIVGNTDTVGSESYNQYLSEKRANIVKKSLIDHGVPEGILIARGAGMRELLVPTPPGVANALNRRAEIITR